MYDLARSPGKFTGDALRAGIGWRMRAPAWVPIGDALRAGVALTFGKSCNLSKYLAPLLLRCPDAENINLKSIFAFLQIKNFWMRRSDTPENVHGNTFLGHKLTLFGAANDGDACGDVSVVQDEPFGALNLSIPGTRKILDISFPANTGLSLSPRQSIALRAKRQSVRFFLLYAELVSPETALPGRAAWNMFLPSKNAAASRNILFENRKAALSSRVSMLLWIYRPCENRGMALPREKCRDIQKISRKIRGMFIQVENASLGAKHGFFFPQVQLFCDISTLCQTAASLTILRARFLS